MENNGEEVKLDKQKASRTAERANKGDDKPEIRRQETLILKRRRCTLQRCSPAANLLLTPYQPGQAKGTHRGSSPTQ
jgi:hypothetical protein